VYVCVCVCVLVSECRGSKVEDWGGERTEGGESETETETEIEGEGERPRKDTTIVRQRDHHLLLPRPPSAPAPASGGPLHYGHARCMRTVFRPCPLQRL
jgi:hypothetical protein